MTVTAPPGGVITAADELEDLLWIEAQGRGVMHVVWRLACPVLRAHPERLALAWADFRESARVRDGLLDGSVGWYELYDADDLPVGAEDRQQEAIDRKCSRADDARSFIIFGPHGPLGGN